MNETPIYGLGDKLKELRKKTNFTQQDIADRLGVSRNSVNRFENEGLTPSTDNLIKLAIIYNISLDYLLGLGKESYLYLYEFTPEQQEFILDIIAGLRTKFLDK